MDFWVGIAAGTLKPSAYTRPRSAIFCNPILDKIPKNPYPILATARNTKRRNAEKAKAPIASGRVTGFPGVFPRSCLV